MDNVIENYMGVKQALEYAKDLNKTEASFKNCPSRVKGFIS